jgi:hypothetical protein
VRQLARGKVQWSSGTPRIKLTMSVRVRISYFLRGVPGKTLLMGGFDILTPYNITCRSRVFDESSVHRTIKKWFCDHQIMVLFEVEKDDERSLQNQLLRVSISTATLSLPALVSKRVTPSCHIILHHTTPYRSLIAAFLVYIHTSSQSYPSRP